MGIFAGENGANWRASGNRWRTEAFQKLEMIVALVPDAGLTMHHADIVLPIAHHYERADIMLQSRHPYVQVLDAAVKPLGEAVDDFEALRRISAAISMVARDRRTPAIKDDVDGRTFRRDLSRTLDLYTMDGAIKDSRDIVQFIINATPGIPKMSFAELAAKGIVRVDESRGSTVWDHDASPFHADIAESVHGKRPYETLTGRQQFYIDHEWFLKFDEALPVHHAPLKQERFPLQMTMGHARHGIHSMWRDDPFLLSLQRGEPDIFVNPDDAAARGVRDGDLIEVFNDAGRFRCMAHLSAGIMPGTVYMYHGWDPTMFRGRQNFSAVIPTAGLVKPTSVAGDYGHLGYRVLAYAPNQTYRDFTCDFRFIERGTVTAAKTRSPSPTTCLRRATCRAPRSHAHVSTPRCRGCSPRPARPSRRAGSRRVRPRGSSLTRWTDCRSRSTRRPGRQGRSRRRSRRSGGSPVTAIRCAPRPPSPPRMPRSSRWGTADPAAKEEVARFYEHFGYELGEDYAWRPDHVSVLLEFMHFLAWHEVQRASTGEAEDHGLAAGLRIAQRDFLRRHLAGWLPGVVAVAVVREDCVPLLAGTLAITADFIAADLAWLEADPTTDTQD
jgi:hypothetical protein